MRAVLPALLALWASPSAAADLTVAKAASVVADGTAAPKPRILPGATVDYSLTVANPLVNGLFPVQLVRNVQIVDTIDPAMQLSLADIGAAGSGPVEFVDGGLLGLGASGLTLAGVDYSLDGKDWSYQPRPVRGVDGAVRWIRARLTGTQNAASSFRLRYRTTVR